MPQLVELSLADYNSYGASISCDRDGTTFAFTIGPVPDATVAALEGVVQAHKRISSIVVASHCYSILWHWSARNHAKLGSWGASSAVFSMRCGIPRKAEAESQCE